MNEGDGSGQVIVGERRDREETLIAPLSADCSLATDVLDVMGPPNGRMLHVKDGTFHPTLYLLIP